VNESDGQLVPIHEIKTREERAYRAYQLRLGGKTWTEVASELEYPNPSRVRQDINLLIKKAINAVTDEYKAEIIDLELDRLDALQHAVWGMALSGDLKAVDSVLKIMSHRARLMNLGDERTASVNTIVVTGDEYVETLKGISS
jgi:hypothetical protein